MALVEHLKYVRAACTVALTGSSVGAAQALHLSQSSVTRGVLALEAAVQQVIFDRSGRGMVPTPQWRDLLQRCSRAFQHMSIVGTRKSARNEKPNWMSCRLALGIGHRHIRVFMSLAMTGSETISAAELGISQ